MGRGLLQDLLRVICHDPRRGGYILKTTITPLGRRADTVNSSIPFLRISNRFRPTQQQKRALNLTFRFLFSNGDEPAKLQDKKYPLF
jgi:hypothetical protein